MGQNKKRRNKERNERKKLVRQIHIDAQIEKHNSRVYGEGFTRLMEGSAKIDPMFKFIEESMEKYRKIDPKVLFMSVELDEVATDGSAGWRACLWVGFDDPAMEPVIAVTSKALYPTYDAGMAKVTKEKPVVPFRQQDGTFIYPYYNERTGRLMAVAEARRQRRRDKAEQVLGTLSAMARMGGQ